MLGNTSVLIKYSNENRFKFQLYAEFFRFIGYFVCEYLKEDIDSEELDNYLYDLEIDLDIVDDIEIFDSISFKFNGSQTELYELKRVFQKCYLFQATVTLQYFSINSVIVDKAGELFKSAAEALDDFYNKNQSIIKFEYEYNYALLYCKQKVNLACSLCKKKLYYPLDKLVGECINFYREYPENANIFMLLGLIYENSSQNRLNAVNSFIKAKENIGEAPYVASVLYRLGKACEGEEGLRWLMNDAYENAYNIMPKYRNIYKVAQQYMWMEVIGDSIEYFEECVCKIQIRGEYMDPLEQEYLFKVYAHLAYLSIRNNEYFNAIEYAGSAQNLRKRIKEEKNNPDGFNKFYYEVYCDIGWDVEEIIDVELDRMSEDNLNRYLGIAYQKIGLSDIAEKYWNMAEV